MKMEFQSDKDVLDKRYGVSLFSGAGIGDLGYRAAGVNTLAMCEIEEDRSELSRTNFPESQHYVGDINEKTEQLCSFVEERLDDEAQELFLVSCTAPCQGMSKNGQGTLLKNIREGKRPSLDRRNRLILPALDIITRLRPLWVVFENVAEMRNTLIEDKDGKLRLILDIIEEALSPQYAGCAYNVELANYGIPQRRQRLITVYSRDPTAQRLFRNGVQFLPATTHAAKASQGKEKWVSVTEALSEFPELDAGSHALASHPTMPFHRVPVLDAKKYEWISRTPPGMSAFDNQCANPLCLCDSNQLHRAERDAEGVNRGRKDTPLYCVRCGSLLPRPYSFSSEGRKKIMSGFTSAYKRMAADAPAPALTSNLSYPCSDQKVHPAENRVLSLAEAMKLQTISDYCYSWQLRTRKAGRVEVVNASDTLIRHVIGESVPPRFFQLLARHILGLTLNDQWTEACVAWKTADQLPLSF